MTCAFCEMAGHNIRSCTNEALPVLLVKLRCKNWKSVNQSDFTFMWVWLRKQPIAMLRVILFHKYSISPKTRSIEKLVAIIMELEFGDVNDTFWRPYLPDGFIRNATDTNNANESDLLIINIEIYQPITPDLYLMTNAELVNIFMPLYMAERDARRADRLLNARKPIVFIESENETSEEFECSICYEDISAPKTVKLGCNHQFCGGCIETHIKGKTLAIHCPLCRREITSVSMVAHGNESLIAVL
jgi:hypothetical protein